MECQHDRRAHTPGECRDVVLWMTELTHAKRWTCMTAQTCFQRCGPNRTALGSVAATTAADATSRISQSRREGSHGHCPVWPIEGRPLCDALRANRDAGGFERISDSRSIAWNGRRKRMIHMAVHIPHRVERAYGHGEVDAADPVGYDCGTGPKPAVRIIELLPTSREGPKLAQTNHVARSDPRASRQAKTDCDQPASCRDAAKDDGTRLRCRR
jgi:hypothetical protein